MPVARFARLPQELVHISAALFGLGSLLLHQCHGQLHHHKRTNAPLQSIKNDIAHDVQH